MTSFQKFCKFFFVGVAGSYISWSTFLSVLFIIEDARHKFAAVAISTPKSGWFILPIVGSVVFFFIGWISTME